MQVMVLSVYTGGPEKGVLAAQRKRRGVTDSSPCATASTTVTHTVMSSSDISATQSTLSGSTRSSGSMTFLPATLSGFGVIFLLQKLSG